MHKQNLHTHSTYCDGKSTLEETVCAAIEKGFDSVGFSSHSYTPFDESYCMKRDSLSEYVRECRRLKVKYADIISVFCGIEQDFYAPAPTEALDYVIGSVHYIKLGDEYVPIDKNAATLTEAAKKYFGGDIYAVAENYYANVEKLKTVTKCGIVGHFDLVTIYSEHGELFDQSHPRYIAAVKKALDTLIAADAIFEINSGAVARGYRMSPYPSPAVLEYIARHGGKITLSSDCHRRDLIDCFYPEMTEMARRAGFDKIYVLTKDGFVPEMI